MSKQSRAVAVLAYLLSLMGCLVVCVFWRRDSLARYHVAQSLGLTIIAVITPVVWAVVAWTVSWVPFLGPVVAVTVFSFVIAVYLLLGFAWIAGMVNALKGKTQPLPIIGTWAERMLHDPRAMGQRIEESVTSFGN